ncbi:MAG TPA: hypothetical protein VFU27_06605 [Terriglobales bacterium]|nr:hypothetical protein [Terriglobales bacterium]
MRQEQDHKTLRLGAGEPAEGPEAQAGRPGTAGSRLGVVRGVILRGATVALDMLKWWPEAMVAGQTCLAALELRQGTDRE